MNMKKKQFLVLLILAPCLAMGQGKSYLTQEEMLQEYLDLLRKDSLERALAPKRIDTQPYQLEYDISPCLATDSTPPYSFYMKKGYDRNTLNGKIQFWNSDHARMTVLADIPCVVYLFDSNDAENTFRSYFFDKFDKDASTTHFPQGTFSVSLDDVISSADVSTYYYYLVLPRDSMAGYETEGRAYIRIQGDIPQNCDEADFSQAFGDVRPTLLTSPRDFDGTMLFTAHSDSITDPKILFFEDGEPTFCDDYKGKSMFDWGKEAKVIAGKETSLKRFIIFSEGDHLNTDFFICKKASSVMKTNLTKCFPLLEEYKDDACLSAPGSGVYNCGAWAIGKWDDRYFPWYTSVEGYYSSLDTYFDYYGLTRNGATEDNADVDV